MEIIDHSPYPLVDGKMSFWNRLRGTLDYGFSWYSQMRAQAALMASLSRLLNEKYILLNNIIIPEVDVTIPMIVVGPTGAQVLYVTDLGGVYRAKVENWLVQETSHGFKNARPNLLARTALMGRAVEVFLKQNNIDIEVQTAVICVNPRMFVEIIRPMVRIILSDAIEKYITAYSQGRSVVDAAVVRQAADLLAAHPAAEAPAGESQLVEPPPPAVKVKKESPLMAAIAKVNFTSGQWLILGIILVLLVLLLIAFIVAVLFFGQFS